MNIVVDDLGLVRSDVEHTLDLFLEIGWDVEDRLRLKPKKVRLGELEMKRRVVLKIKAGNGPEGTSVPCAEFLVVEDCVVLSAAEGFATTRIIGACPFKFYFYRAAGLYYTTERLTGAEIEQEKIAPLVASILRKALRPPRKKLSK